MRRLLDAFGLGLPRTGDIEDQILLAKRLQPVYDLRDIRGEDDEIGFIVFLAIVRRALRPAGQFLRAFGTILAFVLLPRFAGDDERRVAVRHIPLRAEKIVLARGDLQPVELLRHDAVLREPPFRD